MPNESTRRLHLHSSSSEERATRRSFFGRMSDGVCGAALAYLLGEGLARAGGETANLLPKRPHHRPAARSVIHLCMQGGPSQVDLFDPKPALQKYDGQTAPRELTGNAIFEKDRQGKLMVSPWKFARHGRCGAWVSELLPHTAKLVDTMSIIRSMYNVHPNHEPAIYKLQSGLTFPGHPAFGAWIVYGLGAENQNLPAYVVLADPSNHLPVNGVENWMSGYLPPVYQGAPMRSSGSPLLNLKPDYDEPAGVTRAKRDLLRVLDRRHREQRAADVLDARISNYEMAARMQVEALETLDLETETAETLQLYGIGAKETDSFGRRCLLARRLIERGVRFVQLFPRGQAWDNHKNIRQSLPAICRQTDKPVAGLLADLRRRGLLDETLVLWGGEFGRLPTAQVQNAAQLKTAGRDHGPYGFTAWMAGGGAKQGCVYGSTDDVGYAAVDDRVSIQDWHATVLHLLGMRSQDLVYDRNGLGERLTHQFETRVVEGVVA